MMSEDNYNVLSKYLTEKKKNFYAYQLKSSNGLQVVLKGIESDVTMALQEKGFTVKTVFNVLNRDRKPLPLFKVELATENKPLKNTKCIPNTIFISCCTAELQLTRFNVRTAKYMPILGHTLNCARCVQFVESFMAPHTAQPAKMTATRKSAATAVAITLLTTEVAQFIRS